LDGGPDTRSSIGKNVALYTSLPDGGASVPEPADGARPPRPRGGDARALGGRGDLPEAAGGERRRPDVLLHGRADHGQQPGGRPPRPRADPEGRLPALQG